MIDFSIGSYSDKVVCAVVPMQAGHILLGRPWQYDRRVTHDGYRNRYSFVKEGRFITLAQLTPVQVFEDQFKLRRTRELVKKRENGEVAKSGEKRERPRKERGNSELVSKRENGEVDPSTKWF